MKTRTKDEERKAITGFANPQSAKPADADVENDLLVQITTQTFQQCLAMEHRWRHSARLNSLTTRGWNLYALVQNGQSWKYRAHDFPLLRRLF